GLLSGWIPVLIPAGLIIILAWVAGDVGDWTLAGIGHHRPPPMSLSAASQAIALAGQLLSRALRDRRRKTRGPDSGYLCERRESPLGRRRGGRTVKIATQDEVAADFAEYVKATKHGPVVVTDKGKPVVVLLRSDSEEDVERLLMGHSAKLQSILEAAR